MNIVLGLQLLAAVVACCGAATVKADDYHPATYSQLVFDDEFNGTSLDRSRWCTRYVYGGGPALQVPDAECTQGGKGTLDFFNDEQQRYRDYNTAGEPLHIVANGVLTLRATDTRADSAAPYESAMIRSKATFRPDASTSYYITARLWLPDVVGTWPAFWLTPILNSQGEGVWPPEIDILEAALNGQDDTVYMLHMQTHGGGTPTTTYADPSYDQWGNIHSTVSFRKRWIEVGMEWTDNSATWYVDGKRMLSETGFQWKDDSGVLAPPSPILINLAIGGAWAGRYGVDSAAFPTMMQIDHVRVYKNGPANPPKPPTLQVN